MVASDKYSKLDPKDAKIFDLTKRFTAHKRSISEHLANVTFSGGSGGGYRGNQVDKIAGVEKLCTVNKGATVQNEGKTGWWWPSHKHKDGIFDGLYVWHKPEDHDALFEKFKSHIYNKDKTTAATTAAPPEESKQVSLYKLTVSQRLKEVLCSNLMLSESYADKYCKKVCKSKD